jgi:hypothetical protein
LFDQVVGNGAHLKFALAICTIVFEHLLSVTCLQHEMILSTEPFVLLDTLEKECPQSQRGRMKKAGLADLRTPKGLPSASDPETEADRTPRESLLACMTANREPSNQSFETDREATVCLANRRFFLMMRVRINLKTIKALGADHLR